MSLLPAEDVADFWVWFAGFADGLPDEPTEGALDDLLERLHRLDPRLFFELSMRGTPRELVLTAGGDERVFPVVDELAGSFPGLPGWIVVALKPPLGFEFTFRNEGLVLEAAELWFLPLRNPNDQSALGLRIGVPNADAVREQQSVDAMYTILETGIGERSCALDVQHVEFADLPDDPAAAGYLPLPDLPAYVELGKSRETE